MASWAGSRLPERVCPVGSTPVTLEIMMPFYGRFDHFKQAVESVLAQTDPDWRLTIVDDVYPDLAPGEWADAIDDPRVTYIRNEENLRPSRNYNKCIGLTAEPFVVIMGCDDVMQPEYVARVRELLARFPDVDIIQPGVTIIDEHGNPVTPLADRVKSWLRPRSRGARLAGGEALAVSLLRGNWTYFPSIVWRSDRLRETEFRVGLDVVQDLAMLLHIVQGGGRMVIDDAPVFSYRRHSGSVSAVTGTDGSRFVQERTLFDEAEQAFSERGWKRASRVARRHLTSRLNALLVLPAALRARDRGGIRALTRHVLRLPLS